MRIQNNREELPKKEVLASVNPDHENFNFDSWAIAVRQQMLAALQRNSGAGQAKTVSD